MLLLSIRHLLNQRCTVFVAAVFFCFLASGCFGPDVPAQSKQYVDHAPYQRLTGPNLRLARINELFENFEMVEGEAAEQMFSTAIKSFTSSTLDKLGLLKVESQNGIEIMSGDALLAMLPAQSVEVINCVRTSNEIEEFRSFELQLSDSSELDFSTAYLILYAHVFSSGEFIFGFSEVSDTSLYIHDLYEAAQSMNKCRSIFGVAMVREGRRPDKLHLWT